MTTYLFGWIATVLSSLYKLPQIYKLLKTKKSNDISMLSYIIQALSYVLYIVHGYVVHDYPISTMSIIALIQNGIIMFLCTWYQDDENL